jgi:hypothetical protein
LIRDQTTPAHKLQLIFGRFDFIMVIFYNLITGHVINLDAAGEKSRSLVVDAPVLRSILVEFFPRRGQLFLTG